MEGVNNDVLLSSLISAAHFFLQQPTHPGYQSLSTLNVMMTNVYNSPEAPALTTPLVGMELLIYKNFDVGFYLQPCHLLQMFCTLLYNS